MIFTKRQWAAMGIGFVVAVIAALGWTERAGAPAPTAIPDTATTTPSAAATTTSVQAVSSAFPINAADTIASWTFKGTDTGNEALIAQTNANRATLVSLVGKGQYDDYDLYNGVANADGLLGDGKGAYQNYNRAIAIHPNRGLAYMNFAHLMNELGAYHTAKDAYARSVAFEPTVELYWLSYVNFLAGYEPKADTTASVFAAAKKAIKSAPDLLIAEANWLGSIGRFADAIADWKTVRPSVGTAQQASIDIEIAHLQAQMQ